MSVVFVQFMEILTSLIFKVCWFRTILSCVVCVVSGYFRLDAWEKCLIGLYLMMCHKHEPCQCKCLCCTEKCSDIVKSFNNPGTATLCIRSTKSNPGPGEEEH